MKPKTDAIKNPEYLGAANIPGLMIKFSAPCILSLLISALYNIVDQIFIGNSKLSTLGNAATGAVFPFFLLVSGFAWCAGDGLAAFINIRQGQKDTDAIHKCVGAGITFTTLCSLALICVFYPLKTRLLTLFGASENTLGMAVEYFDVVAAFFPAYMLVNMLNAVIRSDGSPSWAMASMTVGAAINIILDPVFIFACGLGMKGAAWATAIGQAASLAISAAYMFRTKTFKLTLASLLPRIKIFGNAIALGLSSFITQMSIVVLAITCNAMLGKYGALSKYGEDIPIAVIGIESKIFTVVINIIVGIVLGCQPIISYNIGAKNTARVKSLFKYILLATLAIGIVFTLLFELAPDAITAMFGKPTNIPDPDDYIEFARKTFRIFLSLVTVTCVIKMTSIFFQAAGRSVFAVISSLIRDILLFVPLAVTLPLYIGIDGVLIAAPIADAVAAVAVTVLIIIFFKQLDKNSAPTDACLLTEK